MKKNHHPPITQTDRLDEAISSSEFQKFLQSNPDSTPSGQLTATIRSRIASDLRPVSPGVVWAKLAGIYGITSLLTLLVCPQFDVGWFGPHSGLMFVFMSLGDLGCMIACGAFYLAANALVAGLFIPRHEWALVRPGREAASLLWLLGSLMVFSTMGRSPQWTEALSWSFGAVMASLMLERLLSRSAS